MLFGYIGRNLYLLYVYVYYEVISIRLHRYKIYIYQKVTPIVMLCLKIRMFYMLCMKFIFIRKFWVYKYYK